jgi:hypothetical protein
VEIGPPGLSLEDDLSAEGWFKVGAALDKYNDRGMAGQGYGVD